MRSCFFPSKGLRSEGLIPIVLHILRQRLASDSFAQWLMLISEFLLFAGKFFLPCDCASLVVFLQKGQEVSGRSISISTIVDG